jgi:hypothetical protein
MTEIRYIKFENHLISMQRLMLYPVMENAECIIDSIIIDDALTVSFDAKKLKAYAKKMKKLNNSGKGGFSYAEILAENHATAILELSTSLVKEVA